MNNTRFILFIFIFIFSYLGANPSIPTPLVNSINVITGQLEDPLAGIKHEFYKQGVNIVNGIKIDLPKGDFRIGRVKAQILDESKQDIIYFFYESGCTEVVDQQNRKTTYHYANGLVQSVEEYQQAPHSSTLYRQEKIFWKTNLKSPLISSRILVDGKGQVIHCTHFSYNDQGKLIRETLYGNLSGTCPYPLLIETDGTPILNGIESYATVYRYHSTHPDLIWIIREDNGTTTTYDYDFKTKQCIAKLKGNQTGLLSRTFYLYDDLGLLSQTIIDDGQGQSASDLQGATHRRFMNIISSHEEKTFSQPLITENKYLDLMNGQEKLLDRTIYQYSPMGLLLQQDFYDAEGTLRYQIHYQYDEHGQLQSTIDSRGETAKAPESPLKDRFNEEGLRIASIDIYGNETTFEYDNFGRLIKTHLPTVLDEFDNPIQLTLEQSYDISDQVTEMRDAARGITKTSYTARGKPSQIHYPDGSEEIYVYTLDGELKEKTSRNGIKTLVSRDLSGRITRVEEKTLQNQSIRSLDYSYTGSLVSYLTDSQNHTIRFTYDSAGRQIRSLHETKEGTKRVEWSYDACGERIKTMEWFGPNDSDYVVKVEERDVWQQPIATRLENAKGVVQQRIENSSSLDKDTFFFQETSTRNSLGQYVKLTEAIHENGIREIKIYDALNRLESCFQLTPFGDKIKEYFVHYNKNGKKVSENHQVIKNKKEVGQYIIKWSYDESGKLLAIHEAAHSPEQKTTRYQYNEAGLLKTLIKPDGKEIHYSYNDDNLLSLYQADDHSFAYRYQYDQNRRLIAIEDLVHQIIQTRRYNAFDQIIEDNLGQPETTLSFGYDLAGRKIKIGLPDHSSVHYHYEGSLLASVERCGIDQKHLYQHDYFYEAPSGRLQTNHLINNIGTLSYSYDTHNHLKGISSPWWSETIEELDKNSRLLKMKIDDPLNSYTQSYTYGDDQQLIAEEGDISHTYQYDSLFNRLKHNDEDWSVNALNQLTQTPSHDYVYDLNGNLIEKKGKTSFLYTYDALNRLTSISSPSKFSIHYIYDAFDRCLQKQYYQWREDLSDWEQTHTHAYLYDEHKELGCIDQNGQLIQFRVLGIGKGAEISAAIAIEFAEKVYAPIHDHQGSLRCLIDTETKQVAEFYRYSAFGSEKIYGPNGEELENSRVGNPWRFSSKRIEEKSGLVEFGKRCYDPEIGRWITPDPLLFYDTPNLYAFVRNDSINHYDLYGLFSISEVWDTAINFFFETFSYIQTSANRFKTKIHSELKLPESFAVAFEKIGRWLFTDKFYILMGHSYERTEVSHYGERLVNDKVRVTFINGILTTRDDMLSNLELISESHGGVKVHYIFRPTEGWTWDISRAIMVKLAFKLGFRSMHAHLLAAQWRSLIHEMGGVNGGGTIIHYAHSLGGAETARARDLLTLEEQKMIRVITFGSATLIPNGGFQKVVNIVSINDAVHYFDPVGHFRNYFDPNCNVQFHGDFFILWDGWPRDHFLSGSTYAPFVRFYGKQFLAEFAST